MARDLREGRHNVVLSTLAHNDPERLNQLVQLNPDVDARLYLQVPRLASSTVRRAVTMLREALLILGGCGLQVSEAAADQMAQTMLTLLDLKDVRYA
jgi:hypothetical protein